MVETIIPDKIQSIINEFGETNPVLACRLTFMAEIARDDWTTRDDVITAVGCSPDDQTDEAKEKIRQFMLRTTYT